MERSAPLAIESREGSRVKSILDFLPSSYKPWPDILKRKSNRSLMLSVNTAKVTLNKGAPVVCTE